MWVLFYGDDTYRIFKNYLNFLKNKKINRLEKIDFSFKKDNLNYLKNNLQTSSLFQGPQALVLLDPFQESEFKDYLLNLKNKSFDYLIVLQRSKLEEKDKKIFEKFDLVRAFLKKDKREVLLKEVFSLLEEKDLPRGTQLAKDLLDLSKGDFWFLETELSKLSLLKFKDKKRLKEHFLSLYTEKNVFLLLENIFQREKKKAFALISQEFTLKDDLNFLFYLLIRQVRLMIKALEALSSNKDSYQFAREERLPLYVIKNKVLPLAKKLGFEKLKSIYFNLLKIDLETKLSSRDIKTALSLFIAKI